MPARSSTTVLSSLLLALVAQPAAAGGFSYPDLGSVALSRGGAFVARADDPTALWYNPAGGALARGTQLSLDLNIFNENIHYQRRIYAMRGADPGLAVPPDRYPHDVAQRMPEVRNDNAPTAIPFFALASDLGIGFLRRHRIALLAGLFGPNAHPRRDYPRFCRPGVSPCEEASADGGLPNPARYDTVRTEILVLNPTLGVAWQPLRSLSVGATFQGSYASFTIHKVVGAAWTARGGQPTEDPREDLEVEIAARDAFTPTGSLGLHWRPLPFLELGLSAQLPLTHECTGEARIVIPPTVTGGESAFADPNPAPVRVVLRFPWVIRSGLRYVSRDRGGDERFDLELDFTWETTSALDELVVETDALLGLRGLGEPFRLRGISQRYGWRDTWSLRGGGSYRVPLGRELELWLRAGAFYESTAAPDEYVRLDFLPLARVGLAAGLGLRWRRWRLNAGYARLIHERRSVAPDAGDRRRGECAASKGAAGCGSRAVEIVPIATSAGAPVGDGVYSFSIDMVTLGLAVELGR